MKQEFSIAVFKTSVSTRESVKSLRYLLDAEVGRRRWNFALEDKDKILRIASSEDKAERIASQLKKLGYDCTQLED